jgi:hypothetical protein
LVIGYWLFGIPLTRRYHRGKYQLLGRTPTITTKESTCCGRYFDFAQHGGTFQQQENYWLAERTPANVQQFVKENFKTLK